MQAPMRKQGEIAESIPSIPGPVREAARILPRLAPGGLYEAEVGAARILPRLAPGGF